MLFRIEFGKLFRRKFNYLFGLILILINVGMVFKLDFLSLFYDMSLVNIIFNIVLKINLILILFIMGLNYIYSYREDYISRKTFTFEI